MTDKVETKELTTEEIDAKRRDLIAALAELPTKIPVGAVPGTHIGEGPASDYVPYTQTWFTDVEARRKDVDEFSGKLKWPNYDLHTVIAQKTENIRINGVGFMVIGGQECKLPSPHYAAYKDSLEAARKIMDEYAPESNPRLQPGYVSRPYYMGPGFLVKKDDA